MNLKQADGRIRRDQRCVVESLARVEGLVHGAPHSALLIFEVEVVSCSLSRLIQKRAMDTRQTGMRPSKRHRLPAYALSPARTISSRYKTVRQSRIPPVTGAKPVNETTLAKFARWYPRKFRRRMPEAS